VEKLLRSIYVDDVVSGASTEEDAYSEYSESRKVLKTAGFNLQKFASNSASLQQRPTQMNDVSAVGVRKPHC